MNHKTRIMKHNIGYRNSQVMLLTVLVLGGTILGATTIGGLLVLFQLRQTADLANSTKAAFAADTGIEWGLYEFFKNPSPGFLKPTISNGATYTTSCYKDTAMTQRVDCNASGVVVIVGKGESGNAKRAFKISFPP